MKAIGHFARSSSFQVGALFTFMLTLGVLFVAYFLHLATKEVFLRESRVAVEAELSGLIRLYERQGVEAFQQVIAEKQTRRERNFYYALWTKDGLHSLSDFSSWSHLENSLEELPEQAELPRASPQLLPNDITKLLLKQVTLTDGNQFIVARDVHELAAAQWVARTFGWLMIATMLLISGLSLWVGYYVVDRINRIADRTNRIVQQGEFTERLPIDSSWDDLSQLSRALNRTLDELALTVQGIKSVSDNIAHDLRTPLTRLRGHIELITDEQQRQGLLVEVDGIMSMFRGLLRIAEVESKHQMQMFDTHNLSQIIHDVIDLYQPVAEEKRITVEQSIAQTDVFGDRDLLFQALANVIDNAIKFTPHGGTVTVVLNEDNNKVSIQVCDSGPGIDAELFEKVTQRFFRAEKSRNTKGNGLGLAMVSAVVKLHGGELRFSASSNNLQKRGLCCTIEIPIQRDF